MYFYFILFFIEWKRDYVQKIMKRIYDFFLIFFKANFWTNECLGRGKSEYAVGVYASEKYFW